jgi:hypothetical protein
MDEKTLPYMNSRGFEYPRVLTRATGADLGARVGSLPIGETPTGAGAPEIKPERGSGFEPGTRIDPKLRER